MTLDDLLALHWGCWFVLAASMPTIVAVDVWLSRRKRRLAA